MKKKTVLYLLIYSAVLLTSVILCMLCLPLIATEDKPVPLPETEEDAGAFATLPPPAAVTSVGSVTDRQTETPVADTTTIGTSTTPCPSATPLPTPTPTILPEPAPTPTEPTETPHAEEGITATVYLTEKGEYVTVEMEEYVAGVLSGEVSYTRNIEAIKAQAVVTRSYYLKRTTYVNGAHPLSPVCDDPNHCMTYTGYDDYITRYGKEMGDYMWNIYKDAAMQTKGEYLTYGGEYIDAMCHSSSHLTTESYYNVYGIDYPYLKAVSTPEKARVTTVKIGISEMLLKLFEDKSIKDVKNPLGEVSRFSDSDRVSEVTVYGVSFKATELRALLSLPSTCFTVEYHDNVYTFTCYGGGHGIGLSQYGAYTLADMGVDYRGIVLHYFPGCVLEKGITEKSNE